MSSNEKNYTASSAADMWPPVPSPAQELQPSSTPPPGPSPASTPQPIPPLLLPSPEVAPPPVKSTRKRHCELELLRHEETSSLRCLPPLHSSLQSPRPPSRTSPPRRSSSPPRIITDSMDTTTETFSLSWLSTSSSPPPRPPSCCSATDCVPTVTQRGPHAATWQRSASFSSSTYSASDLHVHVLEEGLMPYMS